ncbi:hypothetical protein HY641_05180 [Candidatus Woesearchaeota archaeon]|nr:hypothetical protein [Candidatus Woesearchaeota archaeon]
MAKKNTALIRDLGLIHKEIDHLYEAILVRKPEHFSYRDVINAVFAASLFSVLIFNQLLFNAALGLSTSQVLLIVVATSIMLTLEIYFMSYVRVPQKSRRPFGQFWAKRFFTIYGVTLAITILLIHLYNLDAIAGSTANALRLAVATSFPSSIAAGATALARKL